jgi:hypothetical protein
MNSSENCRRTRRPNLSDPILAIVSAFRKMSTRSDQAQIFVSFVAQTVAQTVVGFAGLNRILLRL